MQPYCTPSPREVRICFPWLAFGAAVQHLLREPRHLRAFNIAMGVLLALPIGLIIR